jgi:hypothetical protein
MDLPEKSGFESFRKGRFMGLNPYAGRLGYEFEAWQWDLGYRLGRALAEAV